jgi:GTP:adenosylcobinamide-phosphate guanylyltransferase
MTLKVKIGDVVAMSSEFPNHNYAWVILSETSSKEISINDHSERLTPFGLNYFNQCTDDQFMVIDNNEIIFTPYELRVI